MSLESVEKLILLQRAASMHSYSQEYLSLRARQGKLKAVKRGRNWFTTKEWLDEYIDSAEAYKNSIKKQSKRIHDPARQNKLPNPPLSLPIYAPDSDMWEDNTPEEVASQIAFLRKFQFALALSLVAVVFSTSVVIGQAEIARVVKKILMVWI